MIGDPLDWIAILTGGASWAWDWKFVIAQVLFAFAVGSWCGARAAAFPRRCCSRFPHPSWASLPIATITPLLLLCYSPWILLAWIEGVRAPTLRRSAVWALLLILADWCE